MSESENPDGFIINKCLRCETEPQTSVDGKVITTIFCYRCCFSVGKRLGEHNTDIVRRWNLLNVQSFNPMTTPHDPSDEKEVEPGLCKVCNDHYALRPECEDTGICDLCAQTLYADLQAQATTLRAQLAAKDKEIERLQKFHIEDMRVTNESATFHMQLCQDLRAQLAAIQNSMKSLLSRWEAQSLELQFQSDNCSVDPLLAKQKADCDSKDWMLRNCISELGKVVGDD